MENLVFGILGTMKIIKSGGGELANSFINDLIGFICNSY